MSRDLVAAAVSPAAIAGLAFALLCALALLALRRSTPQPRAPLIAGLVLGIAVASGAVVLGLGRQMRAASPELRVDPLPAPEPVEPVDPVAPIAPIQQELDAARDPSLPMPEPTPPLEPPIQVLSPLPAKPREGIYRVGGEVVRPETRTAKAPVFTEIARRARVQGVVIAEVVVEVDGRVSLARILKGLPFGLDAAAIDALRAWRFTPATLRGRPVRAYTTVSVEFRLP